MSGLQNHGGGHHVCDNMSGSLRRHASLGKREQDEVIQPGMRISRQKSSCFSFTGKSKQKADEAQGFHTGSDSSIVRTTDGRRGVARPSAWSSKGQPAGAPMDQVASGALPPAGKRKDQGMRLLGCRSWAPRVLALPWSWADGCAQRAHGCRPPGLRVPLRQRARATPPPWWGRQSLHGPTLTTSSKPPHLPGASPLNTNMGGEVGFSTSFRGDPA